MSNFTTNNKNQKPNDEKGLKILLFLLISWYMFYLLQYLLNN